MLFLYILLGIGFALICLFIAVLIFSLVLVVREDLKKGVRIINRAADTVNADTETLRQKEIAAAATWRRTIFVRGIDRVNGVELTSTIEIPTEDAAGIEAEIEQMRSEQ